ncbi:aldehyde dehydrogenase [Flammeovirga sp. EKP202]|uniref:aldehyde dehydrogenase family protein n=1 Tax=Flammeovirga sp. EKP202 TaxID=2770592 RepID=UPI00165FF0B3|nr:aldehyde dehydrogenase family protein [Flammeovirga sp. EKP202]MBD0404044.1 aldehyde dehydrogenase [Flammeovirga sp. EKP202]
MNQLTDKVKAFLAQDPIPAFVNGTWKKGEYEETSAIENPANREVLAKVNLSSKSDVEDAIEAADKAFLQWKLHSPQQRAEVLKRFANLCERDSEELAQLEALDVGKAINNARGFDVPFGIECIRYFSNLILEKDFEQKLEIEGINGKKVRIPYGVVGFIFPWNFPLTLCMWGIGPALAAGNTVVIKPAEITPLSTLYLGKLVQEAGIPEGVINIVPGKGSVAGEVITTHPKVKCVSFTGSSTVGRHIGQNCGVHLKPAKLELGGKGGAVVFEDADIDHAAEGLAGAITLNTGQVCCTATRWIIQENIVDEFVEKVKSNLQKTIIQPGMMEECEMGPVVSKKQQDSIIDYIQKGIKEGAKLILGTDTAPEKEGYYIPPTLLMGDQNNICFKEEIFGPIAYITTFKTEEEAIQQVNCLDYGLANSVWTTSTEKAQRVALEMVSGNSWVNAHNVFAYGLPYGGVNGSGNGGGVNSIETLFDYTRGLTIAEPIA